MFFHSRNIPRGGPLSGMLHLCAFSTLKTRFHHYISLFQDCQDFGDAVSLRVEVLRGAARLPLRPTTPANTPGRSYARSSLPSAIARSIRRAATCPSDPVSFCTTDKSAASPLTSGRSSGPLSALVASLLFPPRPDRVRSARVPVASGSAGAPIAPAPAGSAPAAPPTAPHSTAAAPGRPRTTSPARDLGSPGWRPHRTGSSGPKPRGDSRQSARPAWHPAQ